MPPKRSERQIGTAPLTDDNKDDHVNGHSTVLVQPKPCLSCGREISPRAKWMRNWDEIRFCSDRCKLWRSTLVFSVFDDRIASKDDDTCLTRCISVHDDRLHFHLDAWIEASIVTMAAQSRPNHLKRLQDVSTRLHEELSNAGHHVISQRISTVLSQGGEREIIRRAARRIIVLPRHSLSLVQRTADVFFPPSSVLALSQNGGKDRLLSLSDVSHAKGDIEIALERSA